jgi:GNAT superfamily N-acetyltransferase
VLCRALICSDFEDAQALYCELTGEESVASKAQFEAVICHSGTQIIGCEVGGKLASMATLHLLPNMTNGGRPYGLVENVVTLAAVQGHGFGRAVMEAVIASAWAANAYKIMLLTGKAADARGFYKKLGFSDEHKHGMMLRRVALRHISEPANTI